MNRNEVVDLLSTVAAHDRRTVGQVDVDVWNTTIGDLPLGACLRALAAQIRECPGVWIEPGHIAQRVIAERRAEREKEHTRELLGEIQDRNDRFQIERHQAHMAEITAAIGNPPEYQQMTTRYGANPLSVRCPWQPCRAAAGFPCTTGGKAMKSPHPSRIDAAQTEAPAEVTR